MEWKGIMIALCCQKQEKKIPEKGGMYEGKKKGRNKESERGKYEEKGTKGWDGWDGCQYGRKWTKGYFDKSALMIEKYSFP